MFTRLWYWLVALVTRRVRVRLLWIRPRVRSAADRHSLPAHVIFERHDWLPTAPRIGDSWTWPESVDLFCVMGQVLTRDGLDCIVMPVTSSAELTLPLDKRVNPEDRVMRCGFRALSERSASTLHLRIDSYFPVLPEPRSAWVEPSPDGFAKAPTAAEVAQKKQDIVPSDASQRVSLSQFGKPDPTKPTGYDLPGPVNRASPGRPGGIVFGQDSLNLEGKIDGQDISIPLAQHATKHYDGQMPGTRIDPMPMTGAKPPEPRKPFGSQD